MDMDPTTAAAAKVGISLYEAGGLALLLLGIIVGAGVIVFRFLSQMIRDLGARLNGVQDEQTKLLAGVVIENTKSNHALQSEIAKQTAVISQQSQVLRERLPAAMAPHHYAPPTPIPGT
jgi:predicted PurR-regulated permease PerM